MRPLLASIFAVAAATACTPDPPPNWAPGGAPLAIGPAVWQRGEDRIELRANGEVVHDGDVVLVIDRAGRVVDEDREPVAILLPDGNVAGTDDTYLGRVGVANASPPSSEMAWLSVMPDGNVVRFDADGERSSDGKWSGCSGPQMRACTFVTHLYALREYSRQPRSGVGFGIGVGVGVYR